MSHKSIRLLIEDTAKSLADDVKFYYARTSDFNMDTDKKGKMIVLDPLTATPQYTVNGVSNYMKAWNCQMAFYEFDLEASTPEEYAPILDVTDEYVDKFLNKINFFTSTSDKILIQSVSQRAFVKATSAILTGQYLSFIIFAQDDFDYCKDDLDCVVNTDECGDN